MQLVVVVYRTTKSFPTDERFGLIQQLRRAATSVPANIAEGRGRGTYRDYRQYLLIARGSLFELGTHIEVARQLDYISSEVARGLDEQIESVLRPLAGLIQSLGNTKPSPH
jgi:four helix bundle protein